MKKFDLKVCPSPPAMAHSLASNVRVPMTDEEKMCQCNRLKSIPPSEKEQIAIFVGRWITNQLAAYGFDPINWPFSKKEMKGNALWVLGTESYRAIYDGRWRWLENRMLSSQMI